MFDAVKTLLTNQGRTACYDSEGDAEGGDGGECTKIKRPILMWRLALSRLVAHLLNPSPNASLSYV